MAAGPGSTRSLSNIPFRGPKTLTNFPSPLSTGIQLIRSLEDARKISVSPQYIQYLPLILLAMAFPFSYLQTIAPDLLHSFTYLPLYALLNAWPCLVQ